MTQNILGNPAIIVQIKIIKSRTVKSDYCQFGSIRK